MQTDFCGGSTKWQKDISISWIEETMKDDIVCGLNSMKRSRFCIGLWVVMKNGINAKPEYLRRQGIAQYLLKSKGRTILWTFKNRIKTLIGNTTDKNSSNWSKRLAKNVRNLRLDTRKLFATLATLDHMLRDRL